MKTFATLLNKLKKKDSITGLDVWYRTILLEVEYTREINRGIVPGINSIGVNVGESVTILIPFENNYVHYSDWKNLADRENYYTLSPGDLIFIGEVIEEEPTPNDITKLKQKYDYACCEVKSIIEVEKRAGCKYRLKVGAI